MKKSLPTIDLALGKKLAGGKESLARELIQLLKQQLPQDFAQIQKDFKAKNYTALQVSVHKLHGAASYCGTPALKQAAADLELALNTKHIEKVTELYTVLEYACNDILKLSDNDY